MQLWLAWSAFALIVVVIGISGYHMCRAADDIAEISGLSRAWVGLLLLSVATSLPELVTGTSSILLFQAPNVAIGDALGSCVFNMLILVVIEFFARGESLYARVASGHSVSAAFGVILCGFIAFSTLVGPSIPWLSLGSIGAYTPIIFGAYAVSLYTIFHHERRTLEAASPAMPKPDTPSTGLRGPLLRYGGSALFVVSAGAMLPYVATHIAAAMHWSNTFVGTVFVAFATSVPEAAVSMSAMWMRSVDLAVANLLGSNLFDAAIVGFDDLLFGGGPILSSVSPSHAVTALTASIMSGVAIIGFSYRPRGRLFHVSSWVGLALFCLYLFNAFVQFLHGE